MNLLLTKSDWESLLLSITQDGYSNVNLFMRDPTYFTNFTSVSAIPSYPCFAVVDFGEGGRVDITFVTVEDAEELLAARQNTPNGQCLNSNDSLTHSA